MSKERTGYLVLADISGYTAFLTGSEVDHAQEIIEDLMSLILRSISAPFRLVKLEGDAAFLHAPGDAISTERVLEMFDVCYVAFHDRVHDVKKATTCTCNACKSMGTLDLKFFAHYGDYLVQRLAGTTEDLAGPSVILAHRLLKNSVVEDKGIRAYALLTDACVKRLHTRPDSLIEHRESYEHLGEVPCAVYDLRPMLEATRTARRSLVEDEQADFLLKVEFPAPPSVVWEYTIDAEKVNLWKAGFVSTNQPIGGRMQPKAEQHCAHGNSVTVLQFTDVRPFHYYTHCSGAGTMMGMNCTYHFAPLPGGRTCLSLRIRLERRGIVASVMSAIFRVMYAKKAAGDFERLRVLLDALPKEPEPAAQVVS